MGRLEIKDLEDQTFLNPLSIKKIPMVGDKTFQLLSRIGIRTIHTLSEMPMLVLQQMIGVNGKELWKKANGIDENPVVPYSERKSISTERTFTNDTTDVLELKRLISGMAEQLAYQLRKEKWLTSTVVVKYGMPILIRKPNNAKFLTLLQIIPCQKWLWNYSIKVYTRRMRLRLVGLPFTGLVHGNHQMNLFEDTEEQMNLYQTMDYLKNHYGMGAVGRASGFDFEK